MLLSSAPVAQMQVAAAWYISHHRPPAISRKIGSVRRAGGGSGAERRSRNSVRARSYALGNGAPVAVWPRARTRVASPAVPTPHEYPGEGTSSPVHESTRAPGRVGRAARALAAVLWWWCVALLRLVALCAPPPGPSPPPSARAAEDAPSAAACASAPSNTTEPSPPPEPPDPPAHTGQYTCARTPQSALPLAPPLASPRHPLRQRCAAAVTPTQYRAHCRSDYCSS
uniref:SFRICE_032205 n=1 Tax=Spodoptera frugiperda TaxID=7108 RepID=A0A2H1V5H9_SPOFR